MAAQQARQIVGRLKTKKIPMKITAVEVSGYFEQSFFYENISYHPYMFQHAAKITREQISTMPTQATFKG